MIAHQCNRGSNCSHYMHCCATSLNMWCHRSSCLHSVACWEPSWGMNMRFHLTTSMHFYKDRSTWGNCSTSSSAVHSQTGSSHWPDLCASLCSSSERSSRSHSHSHRWSSMCLEICFIQSVSKNISISV